MCYNNGDPIYPTVGRNETKILNFIELQNNIKLKRQYCIDGYFLDGYCIETRTAYEVDEIYHHTEPQIQRDKEREEYIKNKLNCKFVRLNELEYIQKINATIV
jgi:very-short-patch-repair endonuclease